MLGAASDLVRLRIEVDAKEGRVMQAALQIMRRRNGDQTLPDTVIIALGTNIPPTTDELAQAIRIAGPERTLVLVTPLRSRQPFAGRPIWRAQRLHPRQVRVADWARAAAAHPDWLYDDGTHLRPAGAAAYARLVRRTSWSVTTA
jgi:lysophospholipase L1-like esterase